MAKKKQTTQSKADEQEVTNSETLPESNEQKDPDTGENTTKNAQKPPETNIPNPAASTPDEPENSTETVDVLALVDNNTHGLKCGQVHTIPVELVDQLIEAGVVDGEQAAVASGKR